MLATFIYSEATVAERLHCEQGLHEGKRSAILMDELRKMETMITGQESRKEATGCRGKL
jgi:hypothetical protein